VPQPTPTSPGPITGGASLIHLVRHGETAWSRSRRHTGTTDLALTGRGRSQARALRTALAVLTPRLVLSSPRRRATETCRLAGREAEVSIDDRLVEWDYGRAEGRTTEQMREEVPGWSVWTDGPPDGETLAAVVDRVDSLITDLRRPGVARGEVILFGHAHCLRILAARWCGLPGVDGRHLVLDAGSHSALGWERDDPCIVRWNVTPPPAQP
jgi:broad specificity phosphatase PhoE